MAHGLRAGHARPSARLLELAGAGEGGSRGTESRSHLGAGPPQTEGRDGGGTGSGTRVAHAQPGGLCSGAAPNSSQKGPGNSPERGEPRERGEEGRRGRVGTGLPAPPHDHCGREDRLPRGEGAAQVTGRRAGEGAWEGGPPRVSRLRAAATPAGRRRHFVQQSALGSQTVRRTAPHFRLLASAPSGVESATITVSGVGSSGKGKQMEKPRSSEVVSFL